MNARLCLSIIALLVIPLHVSDAAEGTDLSAVLQRFSTQAADAGFNAGWCTVMTNLGLSLSEKPDKRVERVLRPFIASEIASRGLDSNDELADFCIKAIGQHKMYRERVGAMLDSISKSNDDSGDQ